MLTEIDREMQRVVAHPTLTAFSGLPEILRYHIGWDGDGSGPEAQGKRIRPLMVLLSCAAVGGNWRDALPAAAGVELLHNFSLIHDDIEDNSPLRRGRETLWKKWGQALAINAGDALFTLSYEAICGLRDTTSPQVALKAVQIFNETCMRLTGGQHLDISFEKERQILEKEYLQMVAGKTAALLAACTKLGALAGGADENQITAYGRFGEYLGLSFQIQDDWLGLWGNSTETGKSSESDLVAGKKHSR
jgi:geranylgeranyl diphosphate synthase, type I